MSQPCVHCNSIFTTKRNGKFCSPKCGASYRWINRPNIIKEHECKECGNKFPIKPNQNQKWTCSDKCRRARIARITRTWHQRNPERESLYRQRTKSKQLPDSNLIRFRKNNKEAPLA